VISPLLSNIYLHYVLDEWFVNDAQPRLKARSFLVRFADDCVPRALNAASAAGGVRCTWDEGLLAPRSRLAGGGFKPPQAAMVKSHGGERCGKGRAWSCQVSTMEMNVS